MTAADTSAGTRHQLRPGDPLSRESLAFMLQLPDAGIGVAAYTWVNGEGRAGSVLAVFGPGVPDGALAEGIDDVEMADEVGFDDWAVGAMRLEVTDPMQAAVVHFAGDRLDMEYRFDGFHPAYLYSSHPDGSPRFFADDRYSLNTAHTALILHALANDGQIRRQTTPRRACRYSGKALQIGLNRAFRASGAPTPHPLTMEVLYQLS